MDQQQSTIIANGCFTKYLKNPKIAEFFLVFIEHLSKNYDGMPTDEIISTTWGKDIKDLESIVKLEKKREKKLKIKFIPNNMPKKLSPNMIYMSTYYKKYCIDNKIKFNLTNACKAYNDYKTKCKDNNETNEYEKKSNELKVNYKIAYEKQLAEAKQLGTFPEDKPKLPLSAYFRFLADKRKTLINQEPPLTNIEILNAIAIMWKNISIDEKLKYETEYIKDKETYKLRLIEWKSKEATRTHSDINTSDADVNNTIDTSGDKEKNDVNIQLLIKSDITNAIIEDAKNDKADKAEKEDSDVSDNEQNAEQIAEPVAETIKTIVTKAKRAPAKKKEETVSA